MKLNEIAQRTPDVLSTSLEDMTEQQRNQIVEQTTDYLKQNFGEAFNQTIARGEDPPYRGTKKPFSGAVDIRYVQNDRTPVDTNQKMHQVVDEIFERKFGIKARSQATFALTNMGMASHYGTPYYFFPSSPFTVIYSPDVHDIFTAIVDPEKLYTLLGVKDKYNQALEQYIHDSSKSDTEVIGRDLNNPRLAGSHFHVEMLERFIELHYHKTDSLTDITALSSSATELMVQCDHYALVNRKIMSEIKEQYK